MPEVLFYHLTESTLDEALPVLVEKSVARGWRTSVQSGSAETRDALDAHLWSWKNDSFLPHAADGDPRPGDQPVFLTVSSDNRNQARIRFLVDGAAPPADLSGYDRLVLMFDGLDTDALSAARGHWKSLRAAGHALSYYQQKPDGGWEKKA